MILSKREVHNKSMIACAQDTMVIFEFMHWFMRKRAEKARRTSYVIFIQGLLQSGLKINFFAKQKNKDIACLTFRTHPSGPVFGSGIQGQEFF